MTDLLDARLQLAKEIGREISATLHAAHLPKFSGHDIYELTPDSFKARLKQHDVPKLRVDFAREIEEQRDDELLFGSAFGCSLCTTLTYTGLVAALGASVVLSGGMSIPAVLAASGYSVTGLATIISAMTGVTVGAVTAMLTAAGTTLGLVVIGLCEAMGAC